MTIIIGGYGQGLLDSSANLLDRRDQVGSGGLGEGEELVANAANGNLVVQERDAILSSLGDELALVRTYNSRGELQGGEDGWRFSTEVVLERLQDHFADGGTHSGYRITYGDGSQFRFVFDKALGYWVSTDGAGAFEQLREAAAADDGKGLVLTRADQSRYLFDNTGRLTAFSDRNGVRTTYQYSGNRLTQVRDAGGHALSFVYEAGRLVRVLDEVGAVLVKYQYDTGRRDDNGKPVPGSGRLSAVTDRAGLTTTYTYNADGTLARIDLPREQIVNGVKQTFPARGLSFKYVAVAVERPGQPTGQAMALAEIVDASGARTSFDYAFEFSYTMAADDRDRRFRVTPANPNQPPQFFTKGTTSVVDPLGNARATSNEAQYVAWRKAGGYYATYSAAAIAANPALKAQYEAILAAHALRYSYDADGYITAVLDALGNTTTYTYDLADNLTAVHTRGPGGGDEGGRSARFAALAAPQPTLAQNITYSYDANGNLVAQTDGDGNLTTYVYDTLNRLTRMTAAMGEALATRDDLVAGDGYYRSKRVALGYPNVAAATLTIAQKAALRALYSTTYAYDAAGNLITRTDPGGDRTDFRYDSSGNLLERTVYLDPSDLTNPAKRQVTTYAYDTFGNNISIRDAEGKTNTRTYDSAGNVLTETDANGALTRYTYDPNNRLLTETNALGQVTSYAYDPVGNRIGITEANGHRVTQLFDLDNRLIATIEVSLDGTSDRRTGYQYDVAGNRTAVTDANGNATTYTFDAAKRLIDVASAAVINAAGALVSYHEQYTYDALGNVLTLTDRNGNVTTYSYSLGGLLKSFTDALGNVTEYLHDANRQQVQVTIGTQLPVAQRRILRSDYDEEDQQIRDTSALGFVRLTRYDAAGNRIAETDANGRTTEFEYDRNNRLLKEIRPSVVNPTTGLATRYTVRHAYDTIGNEIATTDENGRTRTITFDKLGRRVMVTDANGIKTVFGYDTVGNTTQVAVGVAAHLDAGGNVIIDDASLGQVSTYAYNEFHEAVAETDGIGNALATSNAALYQTIRTQRGYAANVASLNAAAISALKAAFTTRRTYDKLGNVLTETDPLGNVARYAYDTLGRLQTQTNARGGATNYRYDGNDNIVKMTDALGRSYAYVYDKLDRQTDKTNSLGVRTHFDYDAFGNKIATTLAVGTSKPRVSRWIYDLDNRITRYTDAVGNTQRYDYDFVGNRVRVTDAQGFTAQYVYDALNRTIRVVDALSFETRYEYDGAGNRLSIIDARGGITRLQYDAGDRTIQATDAAGRSTRFAYDVLGNVVTQTTAFGTAEAQVTRFVYDAEGNLRQVTDANGKVSTNVYDANDNLISATDAKGRTTTYVYDALARRIRITDATGATTTFTYDAVGNVLTQTDALGRITRYLYDAENRRTRLVDALNTRTDYFYDAVGNRVGITEAVGTAVVRSTTYVYDKNDRLTQETDALGNITRYAYDGNGNLVRKTDARNNVTTYGYDGNNRVVAIVDGLGGLTRYAYDGNGNRTQVTDALGRITRAYFNAANERILAVDALNFAIGYGYDRNGNLSTQTAFATAVAIPAGGATPIPTPSAGDQTTRFAYDKLNRLTSATDAEGYTRTIAYDAVGNVLRTTQRLSLIDATRVAIVRHAYDAANRRIATLSAEGVLTTFGYDLLGRPTRTTQFDKTFAPTAAGGAPITGSGPQRVRTSTYDALGRLTAQTDPLGVITAYEYDVFGNRTAQVEASGTAFARRTTYTYDKLDRLATSTDVQGLTSRITRDQVGNQTELTMMSGATVLRTTRYTYDALDRVVDTTLVGAALTVQNRTSYDAVSNVLAEEHALGKPEARTERFAYGARNERIQVTNAVGINAIYSYDAFGNRIQSTVAPGALERVIQDYRYDRNNRLIAEVDGNGVETRYIYDGAGNRIETLQLAAAYDPLTRAPTGTYQGVPIGFQTRATVQTYDRDNRLTSVIDPMGGLTSYQYNAQGNQVRIIDAKGNVTQNTFDAAGRIVRNHVVGVDHDGIVVTNVYDVFGNVVTTQRGFADNTDVRQTTYTYDRSDRRTAITDYELVPVLTAGTVWFQAYSTTIAYDFFGNQTEVSKGQYLPAPGNPEYDPFKAAQVRVETATFTYDDLDRLTSVRDGVGSRTAYVLDAFGNRLRETTGDGTSDARTISYAYDARGQLLQRVDGVGNRIDFAYDAVGNQISKTAAGLITRYGYDRAGRVIQETDPLATVTLRTYDAFGNEVTTTEAAGTPDERVTRAEFNANNDRIADIDALGVRTNYIVDALSNRILEIDGMNRITHLYFNEANQQIATLDPEGYLTSFVRDSAGNITQTRVYMNRYAAPIDPQAAPVPGAADPVRVTLTHFDGANNIARVFEADGIVKLYERDSTGKLTTLLTLPSGDPERQSRTADFAPRVQRFEYDGAGRLTRFTDVDGTFETYTYDTANNKLSRSHTNPNVLATGAADPVRTTAFAYDKNNRLVNQVSDPGGLNLTERLAYDSAGNVTQKTDARGFVTTSVYDPANRLVEVRDPLGNLTLFGYDRVGNRTRIIDARGNMTEFVYDLANRVIAEIEPPVQVFTIDGGNVPFVRPTTHKIYDEVGNLVAVFDANGFLTFNWYDKNDKIIAELNADKVLRRYAYDASGNLVSATLHMTRVTGPVNLAVAPTPPSGEARTITYNYDEAGRLTLTTYPLVEITRLFGTPAANPIAITDSVSPTEQNFYDAFGNLVESLDKNGNRAVNYYDFKGRLIGAVDAAGFLTETSYDAAGNVVQQRKYRTAFNAFAIQASFKPAAPLADADMVDRTYDAADRLVAELSPAIKVGENAGASVTERVRTTYTYDANGNQLSRTLAAGTVDAATEFSYYDAANRRVALVSAGRTLNVFALDANGNITAQTRYINRVPGSVALPAATLASLQASVSPSSTQDETTQYVYDARNRLATQTDLMADGGGNITRSTGYDAAGNATLRVDPDGNATRMAYDGMGRVVRTLTPDRTEALVEYDAAGLKVRAFAGAALNTVPIPASGLATSFADNKLTLNWTQSGGGIRSWVVWDSAPRSIPAGSTPGDIYANASASVTTPPGTVSSGQSIALPSGEISRAATLYYRVVSENSFGHLSWSEEKAVTLPPLISEIVTQRSGNNLLVRVRFNTPPAQLQLTVFNQNQPPFLVGLIPQGNGTYLATWTFFNPTDPAGFEFQVTWMAPGQSSLQSFVSNQVKFGAEQTVHSLSSTLREIDVPVVDGQAAGNGQLVVQDGQMNPTATRVNGRVQYTPPAFSIGPASFYFGNLAAADNRVTVTRFSSTEVTAGMLINLTLGAGEAPVGNPVIIPTNGGTGEFQMIPSGGSYAGVLPTFGSGNYSFEIRYMNAAGREVVVTFQRGVLALNSSVTFTGRSLEVIASIVDQGLYLGVHDPITLVAQPEFLTASNPSASSGAGSIVLNGPKLHKYYTEIHYNALGARIGSNEDNGVWRTHDVDANGNAVVTRQWGTQEDETAFLAGDTSKTPIVTMAAYDPRNLQIASFAAAVPVAGQGGLVRAVTRTTYDHAERKLTQLDPGDSAPTQYQYDGVGNTITVINPLGNSTRYSYDRRGNATRTVDARGNAITVGYDLESNRISETDALNQTTRYAYDAFGRLVSVTDALNRIRAMGYDQRDRLVSFTDALGFVTRRHYDKRDNEIWLQDANNHWFGKAYDSMGRLTNEYSFQSGSPTDLASAQAALSPANPRFANLTNTVTVYDIFGNVAQRIDGEGRTQSFGYGAFGRQTLSSNGQLFSTTEYDRFGRKVRENNSAGQHIERSYDDAGRLVGINDLATATSTDYAYYVNGERANEVLRVDGVVARNATYTYDATERLTRWVDGAGFTSLNYQYDAAGNLARVFADAPASVDSLYTYDANNRVLSKDTNDAPVQTYGYDAVGNRVRIDAQTLTFDAENRLISGLGRFAQYDGAGNVVLDSNNVYTYTDNNLQKSSRPSSSSATTTTTYDKAGRIARRDLTGVPTPVSYFFSYNEFGEEASIGVTQFGSPTNETVSTYDPNGQLVSFRELNSPIFVPDRTFVHDNEGRIVTRVVNRAGTSLSPGSTQFFYANGNPVGESGPAGLRLAEGVYDVDKIVNESFPGLSPQSYVVQGGETLQSVATLFYGNPSLWYVIADANGLTGSETLRVGTQLKIPNSAQIGRLTADTHVVYQEGAIVGDKLPALRALPEAISSPPAGADQCAVIGAIILVVVVAILAIVLTVVTVGFAAPAAALLFSVAATSAAGIIIGAAVGAAIGAGFALAASVISQGILVGFKVQEDFDWKQVAADVVVGALTGAFQAVSAAAQIALKAAQLSANATRLARAGLVLADVALSVAGEATSQSIIYEGRIEQPWMFAAAIGGPILGEVIGDLGKRAVRVVRASRAATKAAKAGNAAASSVAGKAVKLTLSDGTVVSTGTKDIASITSTASNGVKAADVAVGSFGGKSKIALKDADKWFKGQGANHGLKPTTATDTVGTTVTTVQSPSPLDHLANGKTQQVVANLNAGQTASVAPTTVADFTNQTVGKVTKNATTQSDMTGLTQLANIDPADTQLASASRFQIDDTDLASAIRHEADALTDDDLASMARHQSDKVLIEDADDAVSFDASVDISDGEYGSLADDAAELIRIANLQGATDLDDPASIIRIANQQAAPNGTVSPVTTSSTSQVAVTPTVTATPAKPPGLAPIPVNPTALTEVDYQDFKPNAFTKRLADLIQQNPIAPARQNLARLPDYNDLAFADRVAVRKQFRDHMGPKLYGDAKNVLSKRFPTLSTDEIDDLMPARLYTFQDSPAVMSKSATALNPNHLAPDKFGALQKAADFQVLNDVLRKPTASKLARFDSYLRATSTSLNYFPEYHGVVFRGTDASANSWVLPTFKKGSVVTERGFTSSAVSADVPFGFSPESLFVIQSRTGRDISKSSLFPNEAEVLFRPNTRFRVLDVQDTTGAEVNKVLGKDSDVKRLIYLEELP